jgi:hypothetical protein
MKIPVIHISFLPMAGMAIFPFIFIKKQTYKEHKDFINHEKIHLVQQIELLLIGFYILYLLNYLLNLLRYRNHNEAYLNIVFEKEAYGMENDISYLQRRKVWQWVRFL